MSNFYQILQSETEQARQYLLSAPIIHDVFHGQITKGQYVSFLQQAFHHVKHTVPLLMACGARLDDSKEWLREAIGHYIEEEMGHQEWILNDIAACGVDKEVIRHSMPSFATEMMVSYAYDSIARKHPLSFFGMVNVLEGTSIALADDAARQIAKKLGLPCSAFSYLTSHGALDFEHIDFFTGLMNKISCEKEQAIIIHSAKQFYRLYGDIFRNIEAVPAGVEFAEVG
ncbi:iron-containing redox enzyme family protein [Pseudoalteromonas sp. Of11M-6]|uniref:TenA family transcriptional regulator n=1 Tax=Pseudoalteromonas sp. Of11M-6 TaxID=2917754 RepID=UPI001EF61D1F|nr:iron-containing redox enzyme family protein [Pseudoalteromonas sp. Of11M-6]MCG7554486.1 iron-containing redox enzyme family protein [Pseudoalteromonas sp. Of11M-6]